MPTVKILDSRKIPSRRPERAGKLDTLLTYNIDGDRQRTFITIIPSDAPTPAEITAAIRSDQAQAQAHIGQSFTI